MDSNDIFRVKYYSAKDVSIEVYKDRIENLISNFVVEAKRIDINEIIELYNIQQFFKHHIYSKHWSKDKFDDYNKVVNSSKGIIGKYLSEININNLESIIEIINYNYRDDFWKIINEYKNYEKIPAEIFIKILKNNQYILNYILKCDKIVNYFSQEIVMYMEENPFCAEILLRYYLEKQGSYKETLYFPSDLSSEKRVLILDKYISSNFSNPNLLKLIFKSGRNNELDLPDKLKLKAKRKYEEQMEELFKGEGGVEYGVSISFSDSLDEEIIFEKGNNRLLSFSYSSKWIEDNLDYPTLLNNFIFLFGYTDLQCRSSHVNIESQLGIFEKVFGVKGIKEYITGITFNNNQMLAQLQIIGYCRELEKNNIYLEEIIKWFFCTYLKQEFNADGFIFNESSKTSSYLEKCRNIAAEIDSILKQFKFFCEDGEIDKDLLHMSSEHIFIKNIPSMIHNKYIYPCGDNYKKISHLLFSDQSPIYFIPELSGKYNSFYDLLNKETIYYDMFSNHQKTEIDWLIEQNIIKIDDNKKIIPYNKKVKILKDLYNHNVASFSYLKKYKYILKEFESLGMIEFSSSLFSKPEQDYYNYLLNKSVFDNGLDLRNKYLHGTQKSDEYSNNQDYFIFLRILILIVIKINEEFCLKYSTEK
ncbi:hypothetical protein [Parvimonas sp. G1425]|uniref:hypothetical protein n=1 Tax=Parvimonas sp. G1425 TaxID=3387694 RepID=UPI0039E4A6D6